MGTHWEHFSASFLMSTHNISVHGEIPNYHHFCVESNHLLSTLPHVVPDAFKTLYLLVSSADNFCKQFGPRSGLTKHWA